ncbi:helix-turn-helix domain-containing protein [Clostridium transplantifaecale]|uniref:helix-turn-helix domain-containing protein n=1 Tax=Clostridium transplantifaecale TaxID=2479838 RepID=UPI000F6398D2|nr:helix-turn-helix domain-containing protein [Clostridium transplantifaecale]
MAVKKKALPLPVILAAMEGDETALTTVVSHYQSYIRALATRPMKDKYGNEYLCVDESMRLRLETKLIYSIVTGFKVLPA